MLHSIFLLGLTTLALGLSNGDLKVSVKSLHAVVNSIEDIVISAIITNPTDRDIRVFAKNNVLDASTTTISFMVSKDGKDLLLTGIQATYDFNEDSLYKVIPAGSSIAVNHTGLAPLYDFETHGTGQFNFVPNTYFQTGPEDAAIKVAVDPLTVTVESDVQKRQLFPFSTQTSTPTCGDAGRLQVLRESLSYARSMAGGAASDIRTHPDGAEWNNQFRGADHDLIWYRMDAIAGDLDDPAGVRTINCNSDPAGICGGGVVAYTLIVTSGGNVVSSNIYTCEIFFTSIGNTPSLCTGAPNSNGGVILHELSHATARTTDIVYGCSNAANLSVADKTNNAENYSCMGEAIYRTYNCH